MTTRSDITLPGSLKNHSKLRRCDHKDCGQMKSPEGGCQLNSAKWYCSGCWRLFNSKKKAR